MREKGARWVGGVGSARWQGARARRSSGRSGSCRREDLDSFVMLVRNVRLEGRLLGFPIQREALYSISMLILGLVVLFWRAGVYS